MRRLLNVSTLAVAGCMVAGSAWADRFSEERFEEAPWEEIVKVLPPVPAAEALISVPGSVPTPFRYGIDPQSVSLGPDKVIRYTVVATSESGAQNVAYEGMRCDSRERRIYAIVSGGHWTRARNTRWQPVQVNRNTAVQAELHANAFCFGKNPWGPPEQLIARIKTIKERARSEMPNQ